MPHRIAFFFVISRQNDLKCEKTQKETVLLQTQVTIYSKILNLQGYYAKLKTIFYFFEPKGHYSDQHMLKFKNSSWLLAISRQHTHKNSRQLLNGSNQLFIYYLSEGGDPPMESAKKEGILAENLYEIPTCTICLQELSQDLCTLSCGHCFHFLCITQHFEYRGTCPNCQKRACLKQTRPLHFPLVLNTKSTAHLRSLLSSLSSTEKKQMELLLKQLKIESQKAEKLKNQHNQIQFQLNGKNNQIEGLKEELTRKRNEITLLRKENLQLGKERDDLRIHLNDSERSEAFLRTKVDKLELQLKDYEQVKKYRKIMNQNSEELLKLKAEMEIKQIPHAEMAKQFFQICQMGKLQEGKYRQKAKDLEHKLMYYNEEISKLKQANNKLERELGKMNEKIMLQRKKSQDHQYKCRGLKEKSMQKEDSNSYSNASRRIFKTQLSKPTKTTIQSTLAQNFQSIAQNSNRKPTFSANAKFGGLTWRKKNDVLKFNK